MYITLASTFLTYSEVTGKWVSYSDSFFPAEHEYQSYFFLSRHAFMKFYVKDIKRIIIKGIFWQRLLLCLMKFLQYFLGSRGRLHGTVWHHMNFKSYYTFIFKEIARYYLILYFKWENLHTFKLKNFFFNFR